jgi:fucose permease
VNETGLWLGHGQQILLGVYNGSIGVGWLSIQRTYDLGLESLGILLGAAMLARLITSFLSGRIVARIGLRAFVVGGALLFALSMVGHALTPPWAVLLIFSFLAGMGDSAIASGLSAYVVSRYNARRLSWLHGSFGVGLMLGPQAMLFALSSLNMNWQQVYLSVGIATVAFTVGLALTSARWDVDIEASDGNLPPRAASLRDTLAIPLVWLGMLAYILYGAAEVSTGNYTPALYAERGINPGLIAAWVSAYWAAFTFGRLFLGTFVERVGRVNMVRLATIVAMLGTALIWLNLSPNTSVIGLLLAGIAFGPVFPTLMTEISQRLGSAHIPNTVGIFMGISALGAAGLSNLIGAVSTSFGTEIIGPALLITCVLLFVLHERIVVALGKRKTKTRSETADAPLHAMTASAPGEDR